MVGVFYAFGSASDAASARSSILSALRQNHGEQSRVKTWQTGTGARASARAATKNH